jgi:hypothetical protein
LKSREFRNQNLGETLAMGQGMTLDGLEQVQEPPRRRPAAGSTFRVQGQCLDVVLLHCAAQPAFQEGLHKQRKEGDAQQRLDAVDRLEVDGRHLEVGLELREPLLDRRLPLVGVEQVQLGRIAHIRDQREDAIAVGLSGGSGIVNAVGLPADIAVNHDHYL